jgi:hypothetical protein
MDTRRIRKLNAAVSDGEAQHGVSERVAGHPAPRGCRPFVRLHWKGLALWLMLLVGLVVQVIVVALAWQLVDLSISLMEIWAELARKHLEIILT